MFIKTLSYSSDLNQSGLNIEVLVSPGLYLFYLKVGLKCTARGYFRAC